MSRDFLPSVLRFKRKVHISWHIACISFGILLGIALSLYTQSVFADIAWLVTAASIIGIVVINRSIAVLGLALIAGILIGLTRGSLEQSALASYKAVIGQQVVMQGKINEDPSIGKQGDFRLKLTDIEIGGKTYVGSVWVSTETLLPIKRGDTVTIEGKIGSGFGNMAASVYQADIRDIKRPIPGDIGRQVRDWFSGGVYTSLPDDHAGLGLGYLVGQKQTVPEELSEQFRTIGLIHAVVASGFHLTVLVMLVRRLFGGISKYLSTLLAGAIIIGFIGITGLSPSMSRAGLISGLSLLAWYYGRVIHPLVLLPFAAAVTALYQPSYVWGDIGWYLSFAAFTGVILFAPLLEDYFWGSSTTQAKKGIVRAVLITTVSAQILTLPLTIYVFEYYSVYALIANLLVVPLVPIVMLLVFIAGIGGLVLPPALAIVIAKPAEFILEYMIRIVDFLSTLPYAKSDLVITFPLMVGMYIFITGLIICLWKKTGHNFRKERDIF